MIKKMHSPIGCSLSHWVFYGTIFLQQVWLFQLQLQVDDVFCIWDNIHWIIVSQLHVFDGFPIIPPPGMTYLLLTLDRSFEFRGPHQEVADQGPKISTFTVVNGHSFTNARSGLLQ